MRDRANDLAILQNRAAAHSLHHAAGLRKKLLVRHAQQQISRAAGRRIDFFDLNIILAGFIAGNGGQDRRLAGLDLILFCNRQRRTGDVCRVLCRELAENAAFGVGVKRSAVARQVKVALELAGRGARLFSPP